MTEEVRPVQAAAGGGSPRIATAAATECGPVRRENQDAFRVLELGDGSVALVVADGMGGHAGGGQASAAAIVAAAERLALAGGDPEALLRDAVAHANEAVAGVRRQLGGSPGTTLVAALLHQSTLWVANVGDSRAYLLSAGAVHQISEDHSMVAEQVKAGTLDAAAARHDPRRNFITRALLGDPVEADVTRTAVAGGDVVLLCSDGLWEPLSDAAIGGILEAPEGLDEVSRRLVRSAIEAGSTDNVTVVCARIEGA